MTSLAVWTVVFLLWVILMVLAYHRGPQTWLIVATVGFGLMAWLGGIW
jgi:hypothetical protein